MANVIKHKRGSGSDPSPSDLVVGEVAIRTDVGKLFTKTDSGTVSEIAGGGSDIIINTLSSSSATGGGSATFNGSAYRFRLSQPPSVSAQQLLVSIAGVIQKPVAGSGQPSEGFSVSGNDIILASAPATGTDFFILTFKSLGVSEPADNTVTSAKIVDGAIVNADINASAAIAQSKLNIANATTSAAGYQSAADKTKLNGIETGATADQTASEILSLLSDQNITTTGNLNAKDIVLTDTAPLITFNDSDHENDFVIGNLNGTFIIQDTDAAVNRFTVATGGQTTISGNLDCASGVDITGNITVTGTVDGRDVATDGSKLDGIESGATADQTASEILTLIKTVDGVGSGLDADTLDGQQGSYYTNAANLTGTLPAINGSNLTGINTDLVSDTSPQLGGNLDVNTKNINFGDSSGSSDDRLNFGADTDLSIYHDGTNNIISSNTSGKQLIMSANSEVRLTGTKTRIMDENNSETCAVFVPDGTVQLFFDNQQKFSTESNGATTRNDNASNVYHRFTTNGGTARGYVYANSSNQIGFLDETGNWSVNFDRGSNCYLTGHWLPQANNTYDLGSSSYRWRNIYTNDLNLSNEGGANDVDMTWGSFTIQEGVEDLFLINRRNGKKYKFNLTEIS